MHLPEREFGPWHPFGLFLLPHQVGKNCTQEDNELAKKFYIPIATLIELRKKGPTMRTSIISIVRYKGNVQFHRQVGNSPKDLLTTFGW